MTVGMRFKLARIGSHMSQVQAASMAEISANYLSLVENDRRDPSLRLLERLAKLYGMRLVLDLEPVVGTSAAVVGEEA